MTDLMGARSFESADGAHVPLADGEELTEAEITAYPVAPEKSEETPAAKPAEGGEEKKPGSVVSLDAFRKKQ